MPEVVEVAPPVILAGVIGGLLVFAGVFIFTSLLIVGAFLLLVYLYDWSNPATVPGVTGWWMVVGIVSVLIALLGYSKGLLFLAP